MRNWFLRGLERGVQTTRYPGGPAEEAERLRRGVRFAGPGVSRATAARLEELCPVSALSLEEGPRGDLRLALDLGACIGCGACLEEAPEALTWLSEPALARREREALRSYLPVAGGRNGLGRPGGPAAGGRPESGVDGTTAEELARGFQAASRRLFGRSAHLLQVDAGSCNACESELLALGNPMYDLHRLGLFFTNSPRHADILVVTGAVTENMRDELLEAYRAMPEPKLVVAAGACAVDGGIFRRAPHFVGPVDRLLPVDVYIPGCPPDPYTLLHGLLLAVGRAAEAAEAAAGRQPDRSTEALEVHRA